MAEPLPIYFDQDEIARLHGIAHAAAVQTGAKGEELDHVMSDTFRTLAKQANAAVLAAHRKPSLTLVEQ